MFYTASKVFWLIAAPSNLIVIVALSGLAALVFRRARAGRRLLIGAAALYLLFATAPLGPLLATILEDRFPRPPADMAAPDGIVVLGGAMDDQLFVEREALVLGPSGTRMTEAVALSRRFPQARLVFTGGSATIDGELLETSEAEVAHKLFDALGVLPERFLYEDKSRNTFENAVFTRELVKPKAGEHWLLVTSATHMPRAMGIFRKAGFNVIAWPAHYFTKGGYNSALSINRQASDGLALLDIAAREWYGLLAYWLTAKTDALFPAP